MRKILISVILIIAINNCFSQNKNDDAVDISIPEVCELSNIILAITPYGINDEWEVLKGTNYYKEVLTHFLKYSNHPLIQKVNYSREKWDYYLSFRTDAYGFEFDKNDHLYKKFDFKAQDDRNEFEINIKQIEDFAKVSGFREFYKSHQSYYDTLTNYYSKYTMIPELLGFLKNEFPLKKTQVYYSIVASPLICRMQCHRDVKGVPTDFINVPNFLMFGDINKKPSNYDIARDIHLLFTETDHGFINPTTIDFDSEVRKNFDFNKWDIKSGYTELDIFNEYMTWAVYDVFIYKYFPQVAKEVCLLWSKQNETRGFIASTMFNDKLLNLYNSKAQNEKIRDLYPKLLKWCNEVQIEGQRNK